MQIGIGIVGAGGIAGAHINAYKQNPKTKLVAVTDTNLQAAEATGAKHGLEVAPTVEALLARSDIQAVSICTPPTSHAPLAEAALRAGKHVLCEKPVATTLAEADRMIELAEQTGMHLMVAHSHRFWACNRRVKELLEAGEIGDVIYVTDEIMSDLRVVDGRVPWRLQHAAAGGGVVMDNGVHAIDRLRWWLDQPVTSVYAQVATTQPEIDVEDNALAILSFANGVKAHLRLSFTTPRPAGRCRAEFLGTKGFLSAETWGALWISRHGGEREDISFDGLGAFELEVEAFATSILEGKPVPVDAREGRAALEVVLAIYESARTGQVITLNQAPPKKV